MTQLVVSRSHAGANIQCGGRHMTFPRSVVRLLNVSHDWSIDKHKRPKEKHIRKVIGIIEEKKTQFPSYLYSNNNPTTSKQSDKSDGTYVPITLKLSIALGSKSAQICLGRTTGRCSKNLTPMCDLKRCENSCSHSISVNDTTQFINRFNNSQTLRSFCEISPKYIFLKFVRNLKSSMDF